MSETMLENEQLERILGSAQLVTSPSLSRFLRFIVEETLAGRSESIREYTLGVAVFDRGEDFNPRLDPIVRVQARNLRARIAKYYDGPGAGDPLVIELPKGTYVPVFHRRVVEEDLVPAPLAEPPAEPEPAEDVAPLFNGPVMPVPPPRSPVAQPRVPRYWLAAILLLLILIGIAALVLTQSPGTATVSRTVARAAWPWGILGG
jgi:hypothetical protein